MEISAEREVKLRLSSIISNMDDEEEFLVRSGRADILLDNDTTVGFLTSSSP